LSFTAITYGVGNFADEVSHVKEQCKKPSTLHPCLPFDNTKKNQIEIPSEYSL
jgi:hypothetical protein